MVTDSGYTNTVAYFTKEDNTRLVKLPLDFNDGLAKCRLTSLRK